jgi:hypothetical protein
VDVTATAVGRGGRDDLRPTIGYVIAPNADVAAATYASP